MDISDPMEVYHAMLAYVANPELVSTHGRNALNTIYDRFSSDYVYRRHMEIFREAISRHQRGIPSKVDTITV